MSKQNKKCI